MDQNVFVIGIMIALIVLIALLVILRPWRNRQETEKELKDEAKQNRIKEVAANKVASKYSKKGHL